MPAEPNIVDEHTVDNSTTSLDQTQPTTRRSPESTVVARRDDGHVIDTDPTRLDISRVHDWIANDSYWAQGRSPEVMAQAIAGSVCFGVYKWDGEQVAFARIVTDHATFAWLSDVYVARAARGLGIGTWLAQSIAGYVLDRGVGRIVLATRDAHGVYVKAGFAPVAVPARWMEIDLRATGRPG